MSRHGLTFRGSGPLAGSPSWLRQGHNLAPKAGGVKAVQDSLTPKGSGLRLRGKTVVQPNHPKTDHPMARSSPAKAVMRRKVEAAFHEVNEDEPAIVGKTRRKKGAAAAEKQKVAIALDKARRG